MPKHYDPIAEEEPHIVAEYHLKNCTALIADNYLRRLTPEQKEANRQAARRVAWGILENAACRPPVTKRAGWRVHKKEDLP